MIVRYIEKSLMNEIFSESFKRVLTPTYLGVFDKNTREDVTFALDQLDINTCINIMDRRAYDEWFNYEVFTLHKRLFPLYKDDVIVCKDNPYTYTARLMNAILKDMLIHPVIFLSELDDFIQLFHPILTNKYLKAVPDLDIKKVKQVGGKEDYLKLVKGYRDLLDMDLCDKNRWVLNMRYGIDH